MGNNCLLSKGSQSAESRNSYLHESLFTARDWKPPTEKASSSGTCNYEKFEKLAISTPSPRVRSLLREETTTSFDRSPDEWDLKTRPRSPFPPESEETNSLLRRRDSDHLHYPLPRGLREWFKTRRHCRNLKSTKLPLRLCKNLSKTTATLYDNLKTNDCTHLPRDNPSCHYPSSKSLKKCTKGKSELDESGYLRRLKPHPSPLSPNVRWHGSLFTSFGLDEGETPFYHRCTEDPECRNRPLKDDRNLYRRLDTNWLLDKRGKWSSRFNQNKNKGSPSLPTRVRLKT